METLEIHSKDFLVKWVRVPDSCSIVWQVKPLKKSISFGIYRKNEQLSIEKSDLSDNAQTEASQRASSADANNESDMFLEPPLIHSSRLRSSSVASVNKITELNVFKTKSRSSTFSSNLTSSDLTLVKNYYKLVSGEMVRGKLEVTSGGMFAFIFDNSFSKTISKKVLFSSSIVYDSAPLRLSPNSAIATQTIASATEGRNTSNNILLPKNGELMQSVLLKKRRKKLQGYVKRFFILNFKYGTLSYFKTNDNKLRGQMPIIHSIISANSKTREIFIDSGMEVWDLKTLNNKDFESWVNAFNAVKRNQHYGIEFDKEKESKNVIEASNYQRAALEAVQDRLVVVLDGVKLMTKEQFEFEVRNITEYVRSIMENPDSNNDISSVISNNEFYDAHENIDEVGVFLVDTVTDKKSDEEEDEVEDGSDTLSSESDADSEVLPAPTASGNDSKLEAGEDNADSTLFPLPIEPIDRNCDIPVFDHAPPSLLSFVRKNVGKDLSSLSMPVDMNEPITILQRYAETLEYCDLIDNALLGRYPEDSGELILRIAAFAVSNLSSMRKKIRSSRKPFNPLLGETFELVREDKGFRLLCEKVSHRPPVFALYVESIDWTLSFSPAPSQKFWGKTSEIYTKGTVKLTIRATGEVFTWSQPTCILKNIIAGEKYTEPSDTITVKSSSGQRAVIEFSKGGMFSGRSEDLTIKAFDGQKKALPYTVSGNWTDSMTLKTTTTEKTIWTAGNLLPECEKKFGFTEFTGSLNKLTPIELGNLPPNDSRLRPDLRSYEKGYIEEAERLKQKLEEDQRSRRKKLEDSNQTHAPLFFEQIGGDPSQPDSGEWIYKTGDASYWNRRKRQDWDSIQAFW